MEQQDVDQKMQKLIQEQQSTIERLNEQVNQERYADELRRLLTSSAAVGVVLSPRSQSHLLEVIVQNAAQFIGARSSLLFLISEQAQELSLEVAMGPIATEVKKFRIPLGHGIAGRVAVTRQPIAVANTHQDQRLAIDIASAVNYMPESILCIPLFYENSVVGVLALLEKLDGASFSTGDTELLAKFASIAAVAIAQTCAYHDQQNFLQAMVRSFIEVDAEKRQLLYRQGMAFLSKEDTLNSRRRELALLVHELILDDERNYDLCIQILQSFVEGVRQRKKLQEHMSPLGTLSFSAS